MIYSTYNRFINYISFTKNLRRLRAQVNKSIDQPEIVETFPDSHPRGFLKEFKKRRTTIAENYLRITQSLNSVNEKERIQALRLLAEHIYFSRSLAMPLNAARVQLALMKEVILNRNNKRIQLELMHDFTLSSFGHPRTIRKYLNKLDMIEVPETGQELRDLKMGWDFHVHDNASYGKKPPTQLVIDAFIRGISEITIAYNNLEREDAIIEVLEAGKILGIRVNIAIEFSAITHGKQFHYMFILPEFSSRKKRFRKFLKQKNSDFEAFLHELHENQKKRNQNIQYLIERFNTEYLPEINKGYQPGSVYYLEPLQTGKSHPNFPNKIRSRRLLGELLYPGLKDVLEKRALHLNALLSFETEKSEANNTKEIEKIRHNYEEIKKQYLDLNADLIRIKYFSDNEKIQRETAVSQLHEIYHSALKSGAQIKFIQPLEHGLEASINIIIDNFEFLTHTEVFNMFDSIDTHIDDFSYFSDFIKHLNTGNFEAITALLNKLKVTVNVKKLKELCAQKKQIIPSIGSDATGNSSLVPGMGFIFENRLVKKQRNRFKKTHKQLPPAISQLIYEQSTAPKVTLNKHEKPVILCLGKVNASPMNLLGNELSERPVSIVNALEYINPAIKNLFFILIGFIPAYLTVGIEYALLWFAITGTRNVFVDMISGNGLNPKEWTRKDINWVNLAHSLFWTGFSVPILGFVKSSFDHLWPFGLQGEAYEFTKFFFINIANGMYLASHNYLRGFDKGTIRGNFFRSILAWPLAALFSPLGNAFLIPSIVQAKFWSDFVAAIIEGSGKYKNIIRLKKRVIDSLLPDLEMDDEETQMLAVIDILYLINESTRTKTVLKKQLVTTPHVNRVKALFIKKHSEPTAYYKHLTAWIKSRKKFEQIIHFIICNYTKEQSLYLTNLVASNIPKVEKWMHDIVHKRYQ